MKYEVETWDIVFMFITLITMMVGHYWIFHMEHKSKLKINFKEKKILLDALDRHIDYLYYDKLIEFSEESNIFHKYYQDELKGSQQLKKMLNNSF